MSTTPSAPPPALPQSAMGTRDQDQITIVSHSNLFYWWPVWAVGFLLGILTFFDGHRMATVPEGTKALRGADVRAPSESATFEGRDVLVLPPGKHLGSNPTAPPIDPRLHISRGKNYGVLFATV